MGNSEHMKRLILDLKDKVNELDYQLVVEPNKKFDCRKQIDDIRYILALIKIAFTIMRKEKT